MRKTLLLTTIAVLAIGLVFAWGFEKSKEEQPVSPKVSQTTDQQEVAQKQDEASRDLPDQLSPTPEEIAAKLAQAEADENADVYVDQDEIARKKAILAAIAKSSSNYVSNIDPDPEGYRKAEREVDGVITEGLTLDCPTGSTDEGEGCGNDTNGGCNMTTPTFGSIDCGETICGSAWMDGGTRDTDWYMLNITSPQNITITACADFPYVFGVIEQNGPGDCDNTGYINPYTVGNPYDTLTVNATVPVCGPVILFFAPSSFYDYPCVLGDTTYWMEVTCTPADPPLGACCYGYPDTPVCDDLTEAECCALGGLWSFGDTCASYTCPTTPANDLCENAEAVSGPYPTVISATTFLATGDNTEYCGTSGNANPGVWYSVTGTGNTMTADLCNGNTSWDSKIQVWCNTCDYPICVTGNDDYCGMQSQVSWCTEVGTEYKVLVYQYGATGGTFDLTISDDGEPCSTPPDCVPPAGACCYGDPFTPDCVDDVTEEYCFDTQGGYSWVEGALCTDDPDPCPPIQEGDNCVAPIVITSLPYTDEAQTTCGRSDDYENTCLGSYDTGEDIIYEFTLTEQTFITVLLNPNSTTWTGVGLSTECPPVTCIDYSTSYSAVPHGFLVDLSAGTYYIIVDTWSTPDCIPDFDLYVGPPPIGRCCYDSGDPYNPSCVDGVTEDSCVTTYAGTWDLGLNCTDDPCLGQIDCTNPVQVTLPPVVLDWPYVDVNTTCGRGYNYDATCLGSYDGGEDIIYELTVTEEVTVDITMETASTWTGMALSAECPPATCIAYATYSGSGGVALFNQTLAAGTYYIMIDTWPSPYCIPEFTLTIDLPPPPPANDLCEDAEAITGPYPATGTGTTAGATPDCPGLLDWNGVWYTIDLPYAYNNVTITICGESADINTAGWVLMDDCACDDYILRDAYDWLLDGECTSGLDGFQMQFYSMPAGTIYWPAYFIASNGRGLDFSYTIEVEEFFPPANDLCTDAIPVAIPSSTTGYTIGATFDEVPGDYCGTSVTAPGVWYSLTGNGNEITVSTCNAYTTYDTKISVFCSGCYNLVCVGGNDDNCTEYSLRSAYTFCSELDAEYLVLVHGFSANVGDFQLDVIDGDTCSTPPDCTPPVGRCCYGDFYDLQCVDEITREDCILTYDSYDFLPDVDCTTDPCPTYADFNITPTEVFGEVEAAGPGNTDTEILTISNPGSAALDFTAFVNIDPPPAATGIPVFEFNGEETEVTSMRTPPYELTENDKLLMMQIKADGVISDDERADYEALIEAARGLESHFPPVVLNQVSETEPNNDCASADAVACGDTIWCAHLDTSADTLDYFTFDLGAGYWDVVITTWAPDSADCYPDHSDTRLYLYDDASCTNQVGYDDDGGEGYYSLMTVNGLPEGTYTILSNNYWWYTGYYHMSIVCTPGAGPEPGDNCDDPLAISIPTDLPYSDLNQTNCGRGDNYSETCLGYYDGGEDILYEITVTADTYIDITFDPKGTTWNGFAIGTECPPVNCLFSNTSSSGAARSEDGVFLEAAVGTYYLMIDTWPTPDCIPDFDLFITEGTPPPPPPMCPDDSITLYSQPSSEDTYGYTSDDAPGYKRFDNFGGAYGSIEGVRFWGVHGHCCGWVECYEDPMNIEIGFYEDDSGMPGTMVYSEVFTLSPGPDTWFDNLGWNIYQYDATLTTPVVLYDGWISIQGQGDTLCWFLNTVSDFGDGASFYYYNGSWTAQTVDLSFCLIGEVEEIWLQIDTESGTINPGDPAIDVTVTMDATDLVCENTYTGTVNFETNDPLEPTFSVPVTFEVCVSHGYEYLCGDANMSVGSWPPLVIGGDVTYLVGYFRSINPACLLGDETTNFYASADANGDCLVIGSDVTRMVSYFRGIATIDACPDYESAWPTPADVPEDAPDGWPNCLVIPVTSGQGLPAGGTAR